MMPVYYHRREDRVYAVAEPLLSLLLFLAVQLARAQAADIAAPQPRVYSGDSLVALLIERRHSLENRLELLRRRHAAFAVHVALLGQGHVIYRADADHEKLVKVAGEYGRELEALKERNALVAGLLEHALVEPQPGQFPILAVADVYLLILMHFRELLSPCAKDSPRARRTRLRIRSRRRRYSKRRRVWPCRG